MEVATPSNGKDVINLSTPKKERTKKTSGGPSPDQVDKPPKTPSTETKKIFRTSLVVAPRTYVMGVSHDDICDDVKIKLTRCPTISEKMRGPPLELKANGMQKITVDSKDDTEFKTAAKEAGLVLLTEGLNETKLMVVTPKDANVAALVGAWVQAVDIWYEGQRKLEIMSQDADAAEVAKHYMPAFTGDASKIGRVTYERSTDRLKDAIKECKDGMAIGFESLEVMQMILGALRELWYVSPQGDAEKWFIEFMLEKMKAGGITGPNKDDGWIVYYNHAKIEISANGMSAMGGTKWGAKGEFISTEVLTVNMEAFISPTKGVHSIKSGFREGAPGFEAVCNEMGDGVITVFPRTDEHTESQYIIKVIIKLSLIKQWSMAAKLASLCNDERNDSKASRGITTNTSFGDVTLIWSGDLSKARERNGLHPVMAIAAEGLSDNKELEKKNDELFKTVKTLETRLSTTNDIVKAVAQEQSKALTELTKTAQANEEKSQKKIDALQQQLAQQQSEFSAQQALLQQAQLASEKLNEDFKRQITQMMRGMNKAIKHQDSKQKKHEQKFIAIKELVPFVDPVAQAAGDKRRKPSSPGEKNLEEISSDEEDSEEEEIEEEPEEGSGEEYEEEPPPLEGEGNRRSRKCGDHHRTHTPLYPRLKPPTQQEKSPPSSEVVQASKGRGSSETVHGANGSAQAINGRPSKPWPGVGAAAAASNERDAVISTAEGETRNGANGSTQTVSGQTSKPYHGVGATASADNERDAAIPAAERETRIRKQGMHTMASNSVLTGSLCGVNVEETRLTLMQVVTHGLSSFKRRSEREQASGARRASPRTATGSSRGAITWIVVVFGLLSSASGQRSAAAPSHELGSAGKETRLSSGNLGNRFATTGANRERQFSDVYGGSTGANVGTGSAPGGNPDRSRNRYYSQGGERLECCIEAVEGESQFVHQQITRDERATPELDACKRSAKVAPAQQGSHGTGEDEPQTASQRRFDVRNTSSTEVVIKEQLRTSPVGDRSGHWLGGRVQTSRAQDQLPNQTGDAAMGGSDESRHRARNGMGTPQTN